MLSLKSRSRHVAHRVRLSSYLHLVILLVGFGVGFLFSKITDQPIWSHQASSHLFLSDQQTARDQAPTNDGWNTINVFVGQSSNLLDEDPQQKWFSQVKQDEIILELIGDIFPHDKGKESFFFVDLAANDAKEFSNTLALEHHGWKGLCIEPNSAYWYGLSHRKCETIGALVGDAVAPVKVKFRGVYGGIVGKLDEKLANRKNEPNSRVETRFTVPFATILERFHVPKVIDYLSLDVEGSEYLVMHSFPFSEYTVRLLTVERPTKELKNLFEKHGYVFLKELAWWGETLWAHGSTRLSPTHPKVAQIQSVGRG